jgi:hypothetical protein
MEDYLDQYYEEVEDEEGGFVKEYAVEKVIGSDANNILRLVDPKSVFKYYRCWPVCDDGKKRPFVIANDLEGDSVFAKIIGDYHPYKWYVGGILETEKDEFGGKRYVYESADPELMLQVAYNNDRSNNNGSWKPRREFAFNCIDRDLEAKGDFMGQNWCKVNKHTKMIRMPATALQSLKLVHEQNGSPDEYDIAYTKQGSGRSTKHNIQKAGDRKPGVVIGFITDEELAYERYDLKEECKLSPAIYILKYLEKTIERIDKIMGTNYLSQLMEQAEKEKKEFEAQKETVTAKTSEIKPKVAVSAPVPQQNNAVSGSGVQQAQSRMPQNSGAQQARSRIPQNKPKEEVILCPYCGTEIPKSSEKCPQCSADLFAPCSECGERFSILETVCPKCHAVYTLG